LSGPFRLVLRVLLCGAAAGFPVTAAVAQPTEIVLVPDVALDLPGLAGPVLDSEPVRERLDDPVRSRVDLGELPDGIALAAFDLALDGVVFFALDGWADLPGLGLVGPSDIVALVQGTYSLAWSGAAAGVPPGTRIDALDEWSGIGFLLSFDTAIELAGGGLAADEDVLLAAGGDLTLEEDLSLVLPDGLDLDGLDLSADEEAWYLSFDGSGEIGAVAFDDEDIVSWSPTEGWSLFYDASTVDPGWAPSDLAGFALLRPDLFADGFETGDSARWSLAVP
jgi:hypothetical protein